MYCPQSGDRIVLSGDSSVSQQGWAVEFRKGLGSRYLDGIFNNRNKIPSHAEL